MSSDKPSEKLGRRKSKVSWGRIIRPWVSRYLSRGRKALVMESRLIFLRY